MPFCGECGSKYNDDLKFCPHCGKPNSLLSKENESEISVKDLSAENDNFKTVKRSPSSGAGYGSYRLEDLPEGFLIEERYVVEKKLGQGGFGAVYCVFDKKMEIKKALKVIPDAIASDKEAMEDLRKEAKVMVGLNNENIVRVYDFHDKGSIRYIDMEYVEGKTLTDMKLEQSSRKLPESFVKKIALQTARGLGYAHRRNVIHKDIKPQNVMVTIDGKVKIMDFGIAETVRTSMSRIQNTSSSGTLVYMSPEQIRGEDVGRESDIYSYGAMLYELLSGHPPFYKGDVTYQVLNEGVSPIDDISGSMNDLLSKCLAKNYRERFSNFKEVGDALKGKGLPDLTAGSGIIKLEPNTSSVQSTSAESKGKSGGGKKLIAKVLVLLLLVIGGVSAYMINDVSVERAFVREKAMNAIEIELGRDNWERALSMLEDGEEFYLQNKYINDKSEIARKGLEEEKKIFEVKEKKVIAKRLAATKNKAIYDKRGMVYIEGGSFEMGRSDGSVNEKPVHSIKVSSYYISKYEVTQKLYREVMDSNPSAHARGIGDNNPVNNVSWYDAVKFCNELSRKDGLTPSYSINGNNVSCYWNANGYRLPTEAEWEYASRGGNQSRGYLYSGSNNVGNVAWYHNNSNYMTYPVGRKKSNELGLYDMSGNVNEWCWDWYDDYYSSYQDNPKGPASGLRRVERGGSWATSVSATRSVSRSKDNPVLRTSIVGFRVLLPAVQ